MDNHTDHMADGSEQQQDPQWTAALEAIVGEPGDLEPADLEPADLEPADLEPADLEPMDALFDELLAQTVDEPGDVAMEASPPEPEVDPVAVALEPESAVEGSEPAIEPEAEIEPEPEPRQEEPSDVEPLAAAPGPEPETVEEACEEQLLLPEPDEADWESPALAAELEAPLEPALVALEEEPAALFDLSAPDLPDWAEPPQHALLAPEPEESDQPQEQGMDPAAAEPAPVTGTFDLQPVEPEPLDASTDDFAAPVEEVLAELATIIARRGAARLSETRKNEPSPRPALPPQPPMEEVLARIDAMLEVAPPLPPPTDAQVTPHRQYSQLDDYVVFTLAGIDYAVPVRDVAEIGRIPAITRVPNMPEFVRGLTNLRGEVVPVLSLLTLLGSRVANDSNAAPAMPDASVAVARGRVLFLQTAARGAAAGLVVDEVKGIERIESQHLENVSGMVDEKLSSILRGVHGRGDRLLNVLDLGRLFKTEEFLRLQA